jgi:hypothetical protein
MQGDHTRALAAFEQASAKDSRNISDDFFAGISAANSGAKDKAISYFERVVASDDSYQTS